MRGPAAPVTVGMLPGSRRTNAAGEPGEGRRLDLVRGQAARPALDDQSGRHRATQPLHQVRVEGASSADDHLAPVHPVGAERASASLRGELGQGGLDVLAAQPLARVAGDEPVFQPGAVKEIAPRALRRRESEVGLVEQGGKKPVVDGSAGCPCTFGVEPVAGRRVAPVIEEGIRGPAVEADRVTLAVEERQVGDAAEVEHRDRRGWASEHRAVEGRHEWRTLAAGGDVATAEVGDDIDAGQLGEQRWRVQLNGVAETVELARTVPDGLAVATDRGDIRARDRGVPEQSIDQRRVFAHQGIGRERAAMDLVVAAPVQRQQLVSQRGREIALRMTEHVGQDRPVDVLEGGDDGVHAVERSPGHQSDEHGSHVDGAATPQGAIRPGAGRGRASRQRRAGHAS